MSFSHVLLTSFLLPLMMSFAFDSVLLRYLNMFGFSYFHHHYKFLQLRAVNILGQTPLTLTVKFAHVSDLCARCILDFMYTEYYRQTKSLNDTSTPQLVTSLPYVMFCCFTKVTLHNFA